ncbi:cobalt-precorrin-5B (C(1))-methyltransferase, partial [Clostridium sp. HCS.1]|uniref:cobalt-precorrin-5B (C(1))-methyltransferase n=1 Tax=Clostridium sp. HCS.1 TaxID=3238594 RepID=UPI003A101F00
QEFLKQNVPISLEEAVKCSNFIGETIDMAVELGVEHMLFVSHIGKFIKVAGGIFQTHSRNADARMEILTANAAAAGAEQPLLKELMQALTTEDGVELLEQS